MCDLSRRQVFSTGGNSDTGDIICMSPKKILLLGGDIFYYYGATQRVDEMLSCWMYFKSTCNWTLKTQRKHHWDTFVLQIWQTTNVYQKKPVVVMKIYNFFF